MKTYIAPISTIFLLVATGVLANENIPIAKSPKVPANKHSLPISDAKPSKIDWDMWHKSVAKEIYIRFNKKAKKAKFRDQALMARVSYKVTRNQKVTKVSMLKKSANPHFNALVLSTVASMSDSNILKFPLASTKDSIDKTGTFLWNHSASSTRNYSIQRFLKGKSDNLYGYDSGEVETIINR